MYYRALLEYMLSKRGQRPSSRVAFVGWAFQSTRHGSYQDFLSSFFPTGIFFRQVFSCLRSESILCKLSLIMKVKNEQYGLGGA